MLNSGRVAWANSSLSSASLSSSLSSLMRVVNPSLTNNALRPLTGCVRTTGCDSGGLLRRVASKRVRSSGVVPKRSSGNDLVKSWVAVSPSSISRSGADKASKAAMPLAQRVSPP
ncbi:hypothetical protein D3C75_1035400 [compost metagenome]